MIRFNVPPHADNGIKNIESAIEAGRICGDGEFSCKCAEFFERQTGANKVLLTTSCTHALELSALLAGITSGDEVIMPSYTFVSTANAFVLRGAKIVFTDIRPDTMNIDENLIEQAITDRTRAIVPVHYAGVSCEMNKINAIAKKHGLLVIEDAAQGVMAQYNGRALGSIGDMGCFSFHETKNYSMGEGGAILLNGDRFVECAEIMREKGTDRSKFMRGMVDKYTWVDIGSSYLPSELNAAYLHAQLEIAGDILADRMNSWNYYYAALQCLAEKSIISLMQVPQGINHNAHMFYIKTAGIAERSSLIEFLKQRGIASAFHYVPLHTSPAGSKFGRFSGEDVYTTVESERLLRLPLYYGMKESELSEVASAVKAFYGTATLK